MVMTTPLIDLGAAQITRDRTGAVTIDDPGSPLLVRVRTDTTTEPARIVELTVTTRHPAGRISSAGLSRLPLVQIRHVAVATGAHPNDALWHAGVTPKPIGVRAWGRRHWDEVLDVYDWAVSTGRPGGGPRAVADMWHVARNPTAYRWVKRAVAVTGRTPQAHAAPRFGRHPGDVQGPGRPAQGHALPPR
jgi:hypothetical protein